MHVVMAFSYRISTPAWSYSSNRCQAHMVKHSLTEPYLPLSECCVFALLSPAFGFGLNCLNPPSCMGSTSLLALDAFGCGFGGLCERPVCKRERI